MKNYSHISNKERGAAMMISLVFFIAASVLVVIGMTGPVAREYHTSSDSLASAQSYYLAESAAEDAYYRLKNSMTLGSSDTVTLPTGSATATITPYGTDQKDISAVGDANGSERAVGVKTHDGTVDFDLVSWAETQ